MSLPKRLERIVLNTPLSSVACDIGCDHALVSIELIEREKAHKVIACDINEGPLGIARRNIERCSYSDKIETRLGDGLSPISTGEADTVVIAGMGGQLMLSIIKRRIRDFRYFVLSPQSDIDLVRRFLYDEDMCFMREEMLIDNGKYYNILVLENSQCTEGHRVLYSHRQALSELYSKDARIADIIVNLNDIDIENMIYSYGYELLYHRDTVLYSYLVKEERRLSDILKKSEDRSIRDKYRICKLALSLYVDHSNSI